MPAFVEKSVHECIRSDSSRIYYIISPPIYGVCEE